MVGEDYRRCGGPPKRAHLAPWIPGIAFRTAERRGVWRGPGRVGREARGLFPCLAVMVVCRGHSWRSFRWPRGASESFGATRLRNGRPGGTGSVGRFGRGGP